MYYLGIDLHKDESHVAVLDDDAEVVEEIRVANANLDDVAEEYAGAKATKLGRTVLNMRLNLGIIVRNSDV